MLEKAGCVDNWQHLLSCPEPDINGVTAMSKRNRIGFAIGMMLLMGGWFLLAMAGCSSIDRIWVTRFEPIRSEANYEYFKYTSFADAIYPLDSDSAERTRINWLEKWLADNGYPNANYEIVSRAVVLRNKGMLNNVHDIYYEVKVSK